MTAFFPSVFEIGLLWFGIGVCGENKNFTGLNNILYKLKVYIHVIEKIPQNNIFLS